MDNIILNLKHISNYWSDSAQVKKSNEFDNYFKLNKKDFIPDLLPFNNHDIWLDLDENKRCDLLSYGWILYNLKTIKIESELITPACMDLLFYPYKVEKEASVINRSLCESLTDEAYHILLSNQGIDIVYRERNLTRIPPPDFELIKSLRLLESRASSEWQRKLIRLAFATVSELLVTDYLGLLSNDDSIQDMCKNITKAHAMDELMHASVFSQVFKYIYMFLSNNERQYLFDIIPKAVKAFKSNEIASWNYVFNVMDLDVGILTSNELNKDFNINSSGVQDLLNSL